MVGRRIKLYGIGYYVRGVYGVWGLCYLCGGDVMKEDKFLKERINNIEKVKILMENGKSIEEACDEIYEAYEKDYPLWKCLIYDPYFSLFENVVLWACYISLPILLICGYFHRL